VVELEQIAARRTYNMFPRFYDRCQCGRMLWLFRDKGTIFLRCHEGHLWNIERHCTNCNHITDFETILCAICEPLVNEITQYEVTIEDCRKGLKKLDRKHKIGEIKDWTYNMMIKDYNGEIEKCEKKLKKVKEKYSTNLIEKL